VGRYDRKRTAGLIGVRADFRVLIVVGMTDDPEPVDGDAFGLSLQQCWSAGARGGTAYQLVERDDGYLSVIDASTYFAPWSEWPMVERTACALATGRMLDVGCGAGRHAAVLTEQGHQVVGIDHSPGAVLVAKDRGVDAREADVLALPDDLGTFDSILLLGNNLGLLGSREQAPVVLESLARLANPGARLIGSTMDPYATTDPDHLAYHRRNRDLGRLAGQARIRTRHRQVASDWLDYLLLAESELRQLAAQSPWTVRTIYPGSGGNYAVVMEVQ
jgi:SAM-dependent methyltransferase